MAGQGSISVGVLKVIDLDFYDVDDLASWSPDDPEDFKQWINVTIGDESGGSNYQVHLCTPASISGIDNKRCCFLLKRWVGVEDLEARLNQFILEKTSDLRGYPDHILAKHWLWEYS